MSRVPNEKKQNPILEFITKWVAEPLDNLQYAFYKVLETMGVRNSVEEMTTKVFELPFFNILLSGVYKYEVFNHEVIPKEGPVIICTQHQSLLDPITVGLSIVKHTNRVPYHLAKAELIANPYINIFSRINRSIFVRRGESDQLAIEECIKKLQEGNIIVVYPEGTVGPGNGKLLEFKKGVAVIADATNAPVIPCATYGIDQIFGRNAKMPKTKGIIKIKYGDLIPANKLLKRDKEGKANYRKATRLLEKKVSNLWQDLWNEFSKVSSQEE